MMPANRLWPAGAECRALGLRCRTCLSLVMAEMPVVFGLLLGLVVAWASLSAAGALLLCDCDCGGGC